MNLTIEDENEGQASLSCVLSCISARFTLLHHEKKGL